MTGRKAFFYKPASLGTHGRSNHNPPVGRELIKFFVSQDKTGTQPKMEVHPLDQVARDGFVYYRTWANDVLVRGLELDYQLQGSEADIPYLDAILGNGPYTENAVDELTILGSLMGDSIADTLDMEWVVYIDDNGSSFALVHKTQQVFAFPQDMLLKRAEKGALDSVSEIYIAAIGALREEIGKATTWR